MSATVFPPPEQVKILIVDDEPVNIQVLEARLATQKYQTISAASGQEALEKIAKDEPDLVLLDVMMPDVDGFEVCRRIKNNRATLFLPVVLVTALSDTEDRIKGM